MIIKIKNEARVKKIVLLSIIYIYISNKMLLLFELFISLLYLLYVQFSPQMGNIWWRNDYFSPMGGIRLMVYPLKEIQMWYPEFWDINYFIWLLFGLCIYITTFQIHIYLNKEYDFQ